MSDDVDKPAQGAPLAFERRLRASERRLKAFERSLRVARNSAHMALVTTEPSAPVRGAPLPPSPPGPPGRGLDDGRQNGGGADDGRPPSKPRVRKLRLLLIMLGLAILA